MQSEIQNIPSLEKRRKSLSTRRRKTVTEYIRLYKKKLHEKLQGIFNKLDSIYKKNQEASFNKGKDCDLPPLVNSHLLHLVSSLPMLVTAYKKIRRNKGALTLGYILSDNRYQNLSGRQKSFMNKTYHLPDGMTKDTFLETGKLLRAGKYPWGASRRLYAEKPGKPGSLRPITIPPFMDRVVQASITMVLEAIYEPWFEK